MKLAKRKSGDLALVQYASANGEAAIQVVKRGDGYVYKAKAPGKVVGAYDSVESLLDAMVSSELRHDFAEAVRKLEADQRLRH